MAEINNQMIEKSCIARCTIEKAWWKWTTHEGLLTFFGADNRIELKLGGHYEIYFMMDQPEGKRGGEGNRIISFVPNEMLSFTWNAPPQYDEVRNHEHKTWVVVNFESGGEDSIKIVLKHLGWLNGEEWMEVYNYFDKAWDTVMEWFKNSCETNAEN